VVRWLGSEQGSFRDNLEHSRKRRYEGTCEWARVKKEYVGWVEGSSPRLLWIHAIPGPGKSVLAGWMVDDIFDVENIFFFCEGRHDAVAVLRRLVWQLWEKLEDRMGQWGKRVVEKMMECQETASCRDFGVQRELLEAYLVDRKVVVVLDALDECADSKALIYAFSHLVEKFPQLKVAITSRRTEEIVHAIKST
jgi:hypothetical protein